MVFATLTITTTDYTDTYEAKISIRGKDDRGTINFPFGNGRSTYDSIVMWSTVAGTMPASKQTSEFKLVSVTQNTEPHTQKFLPILLSIGVS
jgi:hypothetical protein